MRTEVWLLFAGALCVTAPAAAQECSEPTDSVLEGLLDDLQFVAVRDGTYVAPPANPWAVDPPMFATIEVGAVEPAPFTGPCEDRIHQVGLSAVENLTRTIDCRTDAPCVIEKILRDLAERHEVPLDLVMAVAWRESGWTHYTDESNEITLRSADQADWGLMQINRNSAQLYFSEWDWEQVVEDPYYNARLGVHILDRCYAFARRKLRRQLPPGVERVTRETVARAAYACYNAGPDATFRPWERDHANDGGFMRAYDYIKGRLQVAHDGAVCSLLER